MNFTGHGHPLTPTGLTHACTTLGVTACEVWTVLAVETIGFGFLADRSPKILFERHVFHHLTKGRFDISHPQISDPVPGGYAGGIAEYLRLNAAVKLDYESALESASWGIGQILGLNYRLAGFAVVDDLVADMIRDEDAQLSAVAAFIAGAGLAPALERHDWAGFARGYNGANYAGNAYDIRLAQAHARFAARLPDLTVRSAQVALLYLGLNPGPIDGLAGPLTHGAILAFQAREALPVNGTTDAATMARLELVAWGGNDRASELR